jgi:hypothetical protein
MTQTHPITPPPELAQKCWDELRDQTQVLDAAKAWGKAISLAYRAGADQELEACLRHLDAKGHHPTVLLALRAARRPKAPSLKGQALEVFEALIHGDASGLDVGVIRRALEALPND